MLDRRLVHVVATARYGSFTAAAGSVGVTQSAITKSIAELERQLGYVIFNRTARGVSLTEEGRSFVERATRLLDDANELLKGKSGDNDPYAGVLRIGVCPASMEWLLVEPVSLLVQRHPKLRLDISASSFEHMVQQLRTGSVDVALGIEAAFSEQPDFRRDSLGTLESTFYVRQGHPLLDHEEVTPHDIAQHVMITPSLTRPYGTMFREIYESQGVAANSRMHIIDHFAIAKRIVSRTDAIGVVAVPYTELDVFKQRFSRIPYRGPVQQASLCCAVRARWEVRPAVRAFMKACRECWPVDA